MVHHRKSQKVVGLQYLGRLLPVGILMNGGNLLDHDLLDQVGIFGRQQVPQGNDSDQPVQRVKHIDVINGLHFLGALPDPGEGLGNREGGADSQVAGGHDAGGIIIIVFQEKLGFQLCFFSQGIPDRFPHLRCYRLKEIRQIVGIHLR